MSETIKTGILRDGDGEAFAPLTTIDQVVTSDGTKLDNYIAQEIQETSSQAEYSEGVTMKEAIDNLSSSKVDKESGKSLSTNDYTTEEKNKLAGIDPSSYAAANHTHGASDLTFNSDLIPSADNTYSIGSSEKRLAAIYAEEVHMGANTLYINDTPVLGSNESNTVIDIHADENQSLNLQTTGVGAVTVNSEQNIDVRTKGASNNITIAAAGSSSNVSTSATGNISNTSDSHIINKASTQITEEAPNINLKGAVNVAGGATIDSLTVSGDLTVNGSSTIIHSETVKVKDNIIEVNDGQTGSGVSAGEAGLKIDRGDAVDYKLVFDETDDMFKMGAVNDLETIASQDYVDGEISTLHSTITGEITTACNDKVDKVSGKGLSTNDYTTDDKNKLDGIADGATANVGTITGITMNGASKGTSGVINLGTVITDVSGKQDKLTAGSNITISGTTISATDTNTWRPLGTGATDAAAGNHTHSNYLTGITKSMVTTALGYTPPTSDTNTWRPVQNNLTSDSTTDSLSAYQGKVLKGLVDGKAASSHTHSQYLTSSSLSGYATQTWVNNKLTGTALGYTNATSYTKISTAVPSNATWLIANIIVNGTNRALATTWIPMAEMKNYNTSSSSTCCVSYAKEPTAYHGDFYYSGGYIYAKTISIWDAIKFYTI